MTVVTTTQPANVYADSAGRLKLGDFGLAVLRHQWVRALTHTISCNDRVRYEEASMTALRMET